MKPFWHPLAGVAFDEPPVLANPAALRLLLALGPVRLRCLGDAMWPALRHGERVACVRLDAVPAVGEVVVAETPRGLRLGRVVGSPGASAVLAADADPEPIVDARPIGLVPDRRGVLPGLRAARRFVLDAVEAVAGLPQDEPTEAESTVLTKYDHQAADYAALDVPFDDALRARIVRAVRAGGRILVVGCGAGMECEELARVGFRVVGLDFAPRMIDEARRRAATAGLAIDYATADVHDHRAARSSLAAVLFTYDVYSFLAGRRRRVDLLRRVRPWLEPGGPVFLSARTCSGALDAAVLTLEWLAAHARGRAPEWGDSHTRWLGARGSLQRSYVHYTTRSGLRLEATAAGFRIVEHAGGHTTLQDRGARSQTTWG